MEENSYNGMGSSGKRKATHKDKYKPNWDYCPPNPSEQRQKLEQNRERRTVLGAYFTN